ncbi:leucine-rich repeat domain-containing protein [Clostridium sp. PL3]|uniref:Leucine-rich repeat domain-containing protein n=1 Tax=Clostridium thailandense TaxID=2794346 RepID=A0A949TH84_9CLOT|nr:leucine-rich repeat domain-containing protein [Clostridium thailandense]MBV7272739.1 leucine-rich repeat domain-containing protein [Clostridium thailandense]
MKRKFLIGILFSVFLLCASNVKAASFTDNQTVDANKTWTIKFNYEIELDDLTKQGISVISRKGDTINVDVKLGQDRKSIIITAPEGGYKVGEEYTVTVGNRVHSSSGNGLKDECNIHFNIKRKPNSGGIVTFKDKNLEEAIRDDINKPSGDVYKSDIEDITELDAKYHEIQDISGIEKLTNLQKLNLLENQISSIDSLKNLTNLKQLTLGNNKISNISVLKNLVNLQTLDLGEYYDSCNQISNIDVLKSLTNLQELNLSGNQLKDISALKNLINLQSIDLSYNEISDISALKSLTNLKVLNLANNKIIDISALNNLTNLQELNLGYVPWEGIPAPVSKENYNEISNISSIGNLINLQKLNLGYTKVKDIGVLNKLSNLQTLDLSNNQINNISDIINALKDLPNLKSINFNNNGIINIGELNKLTNLQTLNLNDNQISNISDLKDLTNLQSLDLSNNQISDVSVLENLTNLQWLTLFQNPVSDADIQALKTALPRCEIDEMLVKKPNIYLYPEKTEELLVQVTPKGKITKSIPEYNGGWKVTVDPSGKIDNTYDFLFYEASINHQFTLDKGWIVNKGSFNEEMNSILTSIGLNSKEKADFIEYWSKELNWKTDRYAAYYIDPKEINEAIKLNLSKEPTSILRVYFYFVPLKDNENLQIKKPEIKEFERNGFTVIEWGGIGK